MQWGNRLAEKVATEKVPAETKQTHTQTAQNEKEGYTQKVQCHKQNKQGTAKQTTQRKMHPWQGSRAKCLQARGRATQTKKSVGGCNAGIQKYAHTDRDRPADSLQHRLQIRHHLKPPQADITDRPDRGHKQTAITPSHTPTHNITIFIIIIHESSSPSPSSSPPSSSSSP